MTKLQGFLATFRIDEELWGKFKDIAKNKQTNASALIIQYIQGVVSSGGVDKPPKATPPNIDISPQPNLDSIYNKLDNLEDVSIQDIDNRIDEKIKSSIQINTPSIQQIEDLIDSRIASACQLGAVRDAIATSYRSMMGQFNGLLEELQDLKSQPQEFKSIPPAPATNDQLLTTDTQSPMTNDQHLLWDNKLMKNPIDSIRKQLKKKEIIKTAEEIKQAFINAGFDGNNHQSLREDVIKILSQE